MPNKATSHIDLSEKCDEAAGWMMLARVAFFREDIAGAKEAFNKAQACMAVITESLPQ